jgi:hypothetical protein
MITEFVRTSEDQKYETLETINVKFGSHKDVHSSATTANAFLLYFGRKAGEIKCFECDEMTISFKSNSNVKKTPNLLIFKSATILELKNIKMSNINDLSVKGILEREKLSNIKCRYAILNRKFSLIKIRSSASL